MYCCECDESIAEDEEEELDEDGDESGPGEEPWPPPIW